jgi:DNA polymerase III delta prime subunit
MLHQVTGRQLSRFIVEGYRTAVDSSFVVLADTVQGSRQHVMRLYDRLLASNSYPALLQRYVARQDADLRPLLSSAQQRPLAARHVGQMGNDFPLSTSQRESLHHFLATKSGEMLAVNGPPGTGKTTLLQSVVATLWVEAALRGDEPPVILAASTNNQAVTNIIDSFAKVDGKQELLTQRWLPDISSFGLYCASEAHKDTVRQRGVLAIFPKSEREQSGFFAARETPDYVTRAAAAFLEHCARFFDRRPASLEDAQAMLHRRLSEVVEELHGGLDIWAKLRDVRERIVAARRSHGTLELALAAQRTHVQEAEAVVQRLWHLADGWKKLKVSLSLLDRVRSARVQLANQNYFAAHRDVLQPPAMDDRTIESSIRAAWEAAQQRKTVTETYLKRLESDQQQLVALKQAWWQWCQARGLNADEAAFENFLDQGLRFRAFWLAAHYWEARWLNETRQMLQQPRDERRPAEQQMARWRRYAKLTPCFVSTLFMAPRFFSTWENREYTPLYEFLDLLIIDEAGQVPADVGGATFALAKRALVVGDTYQIEPVYQLAEKVDAGNLRRYKVAVSAEEQARLRAQGLSSVAGSLMVVAQRASAYCKQEPMRGMFLSEHRRCLPAIIAISNELAYRWALDPCRPADDSLPLPALGYANIPGRCVTSRGSRENPVEAETIAGWLATQRARLEEHYHKPLAELAGVITPFTRQAELLRRALQRSGLPRLSVGTVHTLQGAERRVIIFSPVYDEPGTFFFDQGVNMLNVAVSRAQDSFLVFGNMVIFEPAPASVRAKPSQVLARHLFHGSGVELKVRVLGATAEAPPGATTKRLSTLQEHRNVLVRSLREARQRVVIVSPYLSEAALKADNLAELIRAAVQRKIRVLVYTDSQLDIDPRSGSLKAHSAAAREQLRACGADLRVVQRIHNKTLCVDEAIIVTGSFNWLSAVRDTANQYQRQEDSLQYEGPGVGAMITDMLREMGQKPLAGEPATHSKPAGGAHGNV